MEMHEASGMPMQCRDKQPPQTCEDLEALVCPGACWSECWPYYPKETQQQAVQSVCGNQHLSCSGGSGGSESCELTCTSEPTNCNDAYEMVQAGGCASTTSDAFKDFYLDKLGCMSMQELRDDVADNGASALTVSATAVLLGIAVAVYA
jgi:hypothetical protein